MDKFAKIYAPQGEGHPSGVPPASPAPPPAIVLAYGQAAYQGAARRAGGNSTACTLIQRRAR